jgi:hypothetical protein
MSQDPASLERYLTSESKQVRLKALKLLLRHPDATPIQITRALCSNDIRNFDFLRVFEMHAAMQESWERLRGVLNDDVYEYLASLYAESSASNEDHVVHILELLCTPRALEMLREIYTTVPYLSRWKIARVICHLTHKIAAGDN